MKLFIYAALLVLFPLSAMACMIAPEEATKEQIAQVTAPHHGLHVKIVSVDTKVSGLPHDGFMARADVLETKNKNLPAQLSLVFGPCSIIPEVGSSHYFIVKDGMSRGYYDVMDQPSTIVKTP